MVPEEIRYSLIQAGKAFSRAESELNRPHEDVVTLSACQSVRTSMKQMMRLYLLAHATESNAQMSVEELIEACSRANPLFSTVDISGIECKGLHHEQCDGKYCLSIENVSGCLDSAKQLKDILWSEFKINQ